MEDVNERTTPTVEIDFTDELGQPVIPDHVFYKIEDCFTGILMAGPTEIPGPGSPPTSAEIVLTQSDTSILDEKNEYEIRRLTAWWTYGADGHNNAQYFLKVKNLPGITTTSPI